MNIKKIALYLTCGIAFLGVVEFFGWAVLYQTEGGKKLGSFGKAIYNMAAFPNSYIEKLSKKPEIELAKEQGVLIVNPGIQKTNYNCFEKTTDSGFLLIPYYNKAIKQSEVKLFSLEKNAVVYTWTPDITKLHAENNDSIYQILHPILTKDSGIISKAEYGTLFKLNKSSKLEWLINGNFHHSIEQDADGNLWVPYTLEKQSVDTTMYPGIKDECIAKVSPNGKLLYLRSMIKIMIDNGFEAEVVGTGYYEKSPLHINDIQPALFDSKYWKKGDLLISMRSMSTIVLYRPSTNKIIWRKTGPWLNQHDVNFVGSNAISVFGNDVIRIGSRTYKLVRGHNNFYVYNFSSDSTSTPYDAVFAKYAIHTERSGRAMLLGNKDLLVEETNYGKLYRFNTDKLVWRYMEIVDSAYIARMSWSRYYEHLPY